MIFALVKRLARTVTAVIFLPIATVVSIPKVIRIFLDPEIQSRYIAKTHCAKSPCCCCCCCMDDSAEFDNNLKRRMKSLMVVKYKISPSYFNAQMEIYKVWAVMVSIFVPIFSAYTVFGLTVLLKDKEGNVQDYLHDLEKTLLIPLAGAIAFVPVASALIRELLGCRGKDNYLISAIDEVTYPLKRIFFKNPSRLMDRLIMRENNALFTKLSLDFRLSNTRLPMLNQEFLRTKSELPEIIIYLDMFQNVNNSPIDKNSMDIVKEYAFGQSLMFSSGKPLDSHINRLNRLSALTAPRVKEMVRLSGLTKPQFVFQEEVEEVVEVVSQGLTEENYDSKQTKKQMEKEQLVCLWQMPVRSDMALRIDIDMEHRIDINDEKSKKSNHARI